MNNGNIEFLKELQKEMLTQDHQGQANPKFWMIASYHYVSAYEGCGDKCVVFIDSCDFDIDEFIYMVNENYVNEEEYEYKKEEHGSYYCGNEFLFNFGDLVDHVNAKYDTEFQVYEQKKEMYFPESTIFLTLKEAQEHLSRNKHHYSNDAHTYAKTLFRCPNLDRLMKIVEETKWQTKEVIVKPIQNNFYIECGDSTETYTGYSCTCGMHLVDDYTSSLGPDDLMNYCPNCGTKISWSNINAENRK